MGFGEVDVSDGVVEVEAVDYDGGGHFFWSVAGDIIDDSRNN